MATWEDMRRIALALPGVAERSQGNRQWSVSRSPLVWERPLRAADLAHLGDAAPSGEVCGARVADEGVQQALCAERPDVFFTTPHFDGYPAVLFVLDAIDVADLAELITEAWLDRAPKRAVKAYLQEVPGPG